MIDKWIAPHQNGCEYLTEACTCEAIARRQSRVRDGMTDEDAGSVRAGGASSP
jgi:hypothetical protein